MHVCKGKSKGNVAFNFAIKGLKKSIEFYDVPNLVHLLFYNIDN